MFYEKATSYQQAVQKLKECGKMIETDCQKMQETAKITARASIGMIVIEVLFCIITAVIGGAAEPFDMSFFQSRRLAKAAKQGVELGQRMQSDEYYASMSRVEVINLWNGIARAEDAYLPVRDLLETKKKK